MIVPFFINIITYSLFYNSYRYSYSTALYEIISTNRTKRNWRVFHKIDPFISSWDTVFIFIFPKLPNKNMNIVSLNIIPFDFFFFFFSLNIFRNDCKYFMLATLAVYLDKYVACEYQKKKLYKTNCNYTVGSLLKSKEYTYLFLKNINYI